MVTAIEGTRIAGAAPGRVRTVIIRAFGLALLSLAASCASPPSVNRTVIRNETGRDVWNVVLVHNPAGQMGTVSQIPQGRTAEVGFAPRVLKAREAELRWDDASGTHRASLPVPSHRPDDSDRPLLLEYRILPAYRVMGELRPAANSL